MIDDKEGEINKSAFYALFFCYAKKGVLGENLLDRSCFFDKNFQFLSKKQLQSKKILLRASFERSEKQPVRNALLFILRS